jgi:hypothetical protein
MVELDVTGDFDTFDYREAITLLQPDTAGVDVSVAIQYALRRNIPTREAAASGGRYRASDTRFHFETEDGTPRVADRIIDADGTTFTILEARYDTLASRWRCIARDLTVAYNLDTLVSVDEGVTSKGDSGEQIRTWRQIARPQASITEQTMSQQGETEKGVHAERTFEIILLTDTDLSPNHRITDLNGKTYQIVSTSQKDNISALQSAICRRWPLNNNLSS